MNPITVRELLAMCELQVQNGNGDKNIVISDDNEGNGYHGLFYGFTLVDNTSRADIHDSITSKPSDTIILG